MKQTLTQCPADSTTFPLLRTLGTCLGAFFQGFLDGACLGDNQRIHRRTPNSGQQERLALLKGWLREGSLPEVMKRAKMALAFCWSSPPGVGGSHGGHKWAKENRAPDHTILYHPPGVTCTLPKKKRGVGHPGMEKLDHKMGRKLTSKILSSTRGRGIRLLFTKPVNKHQCISSASHLTKMMHTFQRHRNGHPMMLACCTLQRCWEIWMKQTLLLISANLS